VKSTRGYSISQVSFSDTSGPQIGLVAGLRSAVARHFDVQGRLGFSYAHLSSNMDIDARTESSSSNPFSNSLDRLDVGVGFITLQVDGTFRYLPQLWGPRVFIGLGPHFEMGAFQTSTGKRSDAPDVDVSQFLATVSGLFEVGFILGGDEEWEVGLRVATGTLVGHGKDSEYAGLTVSRALANF
jgi:hypothetical protein